MTYREWWAARRFLFDERFGTLLRQSERQARIEEERTAAAYRRSVAHLKAQQEP
jgi:hypothetical protein